MSEAYKERQPMRAVTFAVLLLAVLFTTKVEAQRIN